MNKYQIVFIDIDDNLKEVTEYTKKIMKQLKNKGIKVVVSTSRSANYAINKSIEANLSDYIISSNGAEVYNFQTNEKIYSKSLNEQDIKYIYNYCNSHDMIMILNTYEKRYTNSPDYLNDNEPAVYFSNLEELLQNNQVNQIVILSNNYERMLVLPNLFKEKCPSLKIVHSSKAITNGKREKNKQYYHNLVLEQTSKETGIAELLEYLKLDSKNALIISNDKSLSDLIPTTMHNYAILNVDKNSNDNIALILKDLLLNK